MKIRETLKAFALESLLVDKSWEEYIDALLAQANFSILEDFSSFDKLQYSLSMIPPYIEYAALPDTAMDNITGLYYRLKYLFPAGSTVTLNEPYQIYYNNGTGFKYYTTLVVDGTSPLYVRYPCWELHPPTITVFVDSSTVSSYSSQPDLTYSKYQFPFNFRPGSLLAANRACYLNHTRFNTFYYQVEIFEVPGPLEDGFFVDDNRFWVNDHMIYLPNTDYIFCSDSHQAYVAFGEDYESSPKMSIVSFDRHLLVVDGTVSRADVEGVGGPAKHMWILHRIPNYLKAGEDNEVNINVYTRNESFEQFIRECIPYWVDNVDLYFDLV